MGSITLGRGTGATTKQMTEAPQGAVYFWPNHRLAYPKGLAQHLGRDDLEIKSISLLDDGVEGQNSRVVIDHAAWGSMSSRQYDLVLVLRAKGRLVE